MIRRDRPTVAAVAIGIGGALMVMLWLIFTSLHGPTSFNADGRLLGRDPLFWGSLMSGVPSLSIALGLALLSPLLARGTREARIGYWLAQISLVVPAAVDLATGALWPPLLLPVEAVGLLLLAHGTQRRADLPRAIPTILAAMGALALAAFLWAAAPSAEFSDRVGGYRIFGVMAFVMMGAGWISVAVTLRPRPPESP
jgi:hypothetical protein